MTEKSIPFPLIGVLRIQQWKHKERQHDGVKNGAGSLNEKRGFERERGDRSEFTRWERGREEAIWRIGSEEDLPSEADESKWFCHVVNVLEQRALARQHLKELNWLL